VLLRADEESGDEFGVRVGGLAELELEENRSFDVEVYIRSRTRVGLADNFDELNGGDRAGGIIGASIAEAAIAAVRGLCDNAALDEVAVDGDFPAEDPTSLVVKS
jgi:hypothetical protein